MKKIIIKTENAGKRVDKFLSEEFFSMSRGEIIRQIKNEKVLICGKSVKPSYILVENDELEINFQIDEKKLKPNSNIKIEILFEDENMVVVNKPAGIQMHPSAVEKENTVANWLLAKYPQIENVHDEGVDAKLRPGIVHRLDMDTSGIFVAAKNMKSFLALKEIFSKRNAEKKYWALVFGNINPKEGVIEKALTRATNFKKQKIAQGKIIGKVQSAITKYRVLESYEGYDLVEAWPRTGRMHQIRVHFYSIGHPVVGDRKYLLKKYQEAHIGSVKRQLLHAKELKFELFGKKHEFVCDIPGDFAKTLETVRSGLTK